MPTPRHAQTPVPPDTIDVVDAPPGDRANDPAYQPAETPYPRSRHIPGLTWAPELIRRGAGGTGDNWPMTWGDDDRLYASWGDGYGFDLGATKLSLGVAVIDGTPPDHRGHNVPSDVDAAYGGGKAGIKSSGLLMVDGVLYLWVRNRIVNGDFRHAHLAVSRDRGTTWSWADWTFSGTFGCPEFVQFGPNYAGARDDFVYVVSQANDDAYIFDPDVVLARVPRQHVADRARYEFFAGANGSGRQPRWSSDIAARRPIFTDPRGTERVSITYNAPLGRYLLVSAHRDGTDRLHTPCLGVFDAPEPWGPWTTVYYSERFNEGWTIHQKFPAKWMSADGRTTWLVFSGRNLPPVEAGPGQPGHPGSVLNCLVVRKATLTTPG